MDKHSDSEENYFTEEHFLTVCTDLFMAGADTTSNTLEFAILFMALNPDVQRKVQEEIEIIFGDRLPSLNFKNVMPYTEATTLEILRHSCTIPVTGRCPMADFHINGAPVMKDSLIAINIYGIHYSKKIWTDPELFRPERFLCPDGKIINRDKIMPFGHGKRKCLGESTSRNTFFLFFVSMLQKFSFQLSPKYPAPSLQQVCGLSRAPKPFSVSILKR
ncbi:unnamed protein product [Allacma fusca]|uniref:Cytochrome P450 n=1 Tax=Allacma fusca TaxID=39272 RepID=A0A8J2JPX1_9HEXA|nr:unnamed protein product [Allacma fusca]